MSKRLIKIICICALVVLVPLVVVGVSLMSTEAVGCTLTIADAGIETLQAEGTGFGEKSSKVSIYVEGKLQDKKQVKVTKNSEIKVVYDTEVSVGYDFKGWYEGKYGSIVLEGEKADKPLSEVATYTFKIKKDTTLTAVRDVKNYIVNYHEKESALEFYKSERLEYNQPISEIPEENEGFQGWYAKVGNVANQTVLTAIFETSGEVDLFPGYDNQMLVQYFKGGEKIGSVRLFENQLSGYTLPVVTDDIVKNNITLGYEFGGWVNQVDKTEVTSISYDVNGVNLEMKENLITYTMNVKFHTLSDEISQMTYDVKEGFKGNALTRENYTLVGLSYNGTTYNYDKNSNTYGALATALLTGSERTVDAVAVWECTYPQGVVFFLGACDDAGWDVVYGTNIQTEEFDVPMFIKDQTVYFQDKEGNDYFDVNGDVCDYFINNYTDVKDINGNDVTFTGRVRIYVNDLLGYASYTMESEELTFADILNIARDFNEGSMENITNIQIDFIYA